MKKGRLGYTLVEVALFLAISAALFVGLTVGVQNSISNQRYNDSVQSFMEFLRNIYAEVANVQNVDKGGRSGKAIYGKLVTFGETTGLAGNKNDTSNNPLDLNTIFVYTVVGDAKDTGENDAAKALGALNADVVEIKKGNGGKNELVLAGYPESYLPKWGTQIEKTCEDAGNCNTEQLTGMLLIVRHPTSGVVNTYFTDNVIQINEEVGNRNRDGRSDSILNLTEFTNSKPVDFCVRPDAEGGNQRRSDVRIIKNARNASGIVLIGEDEAGFKCKW